MLKRIVNKEIYQTFPKNLDKEIDQQSFSYVAIAFIYLYLLFYNNCPWSSYLESRDST